MATKEKWIDLFEKAVGRPPHALEIEEGQKADFDLKAIKGIAAMGLDHQATLLNQQKKLMSMTLPRKCLKMYRLVMKRKQLL